MSSRSVLTTSTFGFAFSFFSRSPKQCQANTTQLLTPKLTPYLLLSLPSSSFSSLPLFAMDYGQNINKYHSNCCETIPASSRLPSSSSSSSSSSSLSSSTSSLSMDETVRESSANLVPGLAYVCVYVCVCV